MSLFDPLTGKVIDREALRSLSFNGKGMRVPHTYVDRSSDVKHVETVDDATGRMDGFQTMHGSGRVDCHAIVEPVNLTAQLEH